MTIEFTADESTVTIGGHRYTAQVGVVPGSCRGCALTRGFGCMLWRAGGPSKCTTDQRQDARSIVWVPADKESFP